MYLEIRQDKTNEDTRRRRIINMEIRNPYSVGLISLRDTLCEERGERERFIGIHYEMTMISNNAADDGS